MDPFFTLDQTLDSRVALGLGGRFYGVYPALVIDIVDPDGQGRVKVRLPWSPDGQGGGYEAWARLATMMAGFNRGSWFIPDVEDEVLIAFEGGDARRPYMVGMLWNGRDEPPEQMDPAGNNFLKVIRSRNGVKITLDDTDGVETMILETPGGQVITLTDAPPMIEAKDSNGNTITMDPAGITVITPAKLTIEALTIEATATMVTVNSPITEFTGLVKAAMVKTDAVISGSYNNAPGNMR